MDHSQLDKTLLILSKLEVIHEITLLATSSSIPTSRSDKEGKIQRHWGADEVGNKMDYGCGHRLNEVAAVIRRTTTQLQTPFFFLPGRPTTSHMEKIYQRSKPGIGLASPGASVHAGKPGSRRAVAYL